jgi:hypothetical protein
VNSEAITTNIDPIQAVKDVAGEGATRADRRRALRELKRQVRYQQTGFFPDFRYTPMKGSRSKYEPHIGAKEQGRHA